MEEISAEILQLHVFKYLTLDDLTNCRLVCKKFNSACDQLKIEELTVNDRPEKFKNFWSFSYKVIDYSRASRWNALLAFRSLFKLDTNLLYLHLGYFEYDFTVAKLVPILDLLPQLVRLDVSDVRLDDKHTISLPNLKRLKLNYHQTRSGCRLDLKCPKLRRLQVPNLWCVWIDSRKSLQYLAVRIYSDDIEEFKNLKVLHLDYTLSQCLYVNPDILTRLKKLRELHFALKMSDAEYEVFRDETLSHIIEQKQTLERTELKIVLQGVHLTNNEHLNDEEMHKNPLRFQMNNYDRLEDALPEFTCLHYHVLLALTNGAIPADYHMKFFNIRTIISRGAIDRVQFIGFLERLNFLDTLDLTDSSMDQAFYTRLTEIASQLKIIKVHEAEGTTLDFDFLLKFRQLSHFQTNLDLDSLFELVTKLYTQLKSFHSFTSRLKSNWMQITPHWDNPSKYDLRFYPFALGAIETDSEASFEKELLTLDELATFCGSMKSGGCTMTRKRKKFVHDLANETARRR